MLISGEQLNADLLNRLIPYWTNCPHSSDNITVTQDIQSSISSIPRILVSVAWIHTRQENFDGHP